MKKNPEKNPQKTNKTKTKTERFCLKKLASFEDSVRFG